MKLYSALIKKNEEGKISDAKLLKEGFSFFAFLFGPFWFAYHKMWQEFFVLLAVDVALGFFGGFDKIILEISLEFMVAINANYWLAQHLKKKNYSLDGIFLGENFAVAQLKFAQFLQQSNLVLSEEFLCPKFFYKS